MEHEQVQLLLQKIDKIRGPNVVLHPRQRDTSLAWSWLVEHGYLRRSAYYTDSDEGEDREAVEERDEQGTYWADRVQGEPLTERQLARLYFTYVTTEKLDELRPMPFDDSTAMDEVGKALREHRALVSDMATAQSTILLYRAALAALEKIELIAIKAGRDLL